MYVLFLSFFFFFGGGGGSKILLGDVVCLFMLFKVVEVDCKGVERRLASKKNSLFGERFNLIGSWTLGM